jgi:hypothetical protein
MAPDLDLDRSTLPCLASRSQEGSNSSCKNVSIVDIKSFSGRTMDPGNVIGWGADWAWGLPIIVLTVIIHAFGLGLINKKAASTLSGSGRAGQLSAVSIFVMGGAALSATILHALEAGIWAGAYLLLGALQDFKGAMLYSLNAMTSYGHESLMLVPHWQMMGALEALNGWILFGLTTASLFTVMQKTWPRA